MRVTSGELMDLLLGLLAIVREGTGLQVTGLSERTTDVFTGGTSFDIWENFGVNGIFAETEPIEESGGVEYHAALAKDDGRTEPLESALWWPSWDDGPKDRDATRTVWSCCAEIKGVEAKDRNRNGHSTSGFESMGARERSGAPMRSRAAD